MECNLSEILGALSLATDLADGHPSGSAMGSAVIATNLGKAMGLQPEEQSELYYAAICRSIGCTSTASDVSPLALGEEHTLNHCYTIGDPLDPENLRHHLNNSFAPDHPNEMRQPVIDQCVAAGADMLPLADPQCEQASALSKRLPVPGRVSSLVEQRISRWDGGNPSQPGGEDILQGSRIIEFAVVMELHRRIGGLPAMVEVAQKRSGTQFDPAVCNTFLKDPTAIYRGLGTGWDWEHYQTMEPGDPIIIGQAEVRAIAEAFADFIDLKTPRLLGHSHNVAALAFRGAVARGMPEDECQHLFNAGLLHDIGKSAIPNGIWDKTGPLSRQELQRAKTCSHHTEQILMTSPIFDNIVDAACSTNERNDGSGSHRRIKLNDDASGLLAVANAYDELTRDVPGRDALSSEDAADVMLEEVMKGRFPREATRTILAESGHSKSVTSNVYPDGLTPREAEVLMHISRGLSNKEIAQKLEISPRTIDNHSQNLFKKIGAPGRTAAAMYAIDQGIFNTD
ncbi:MAG: HD domain-containing phosphohydrolase [Leucothrix sp.]